MRWGILVAASAALVLAATAAASRAAGPATTDRDPVFSPGGKAIAFVRWTSRTGTGRVLLMHRDGRGLRVLTPAQQLPYGLTWSPDGRSLAYASGGDIWRIDLAPDSTPVNLTHDASHSSQQPSWSPDPENAWIAYTRFESCFRCAALHLVRPDGSDDRDLSPLGGNVRRPVFGADGQTILISGSTTLAVDLSGKPLWRAPFVGAYNSFWPGGAGVLSIAGGLWTIHGPTGTHRLLTSAVKAFPAASRDGLRIAGTGYRGALAIVTASGAPVATIRAADTLDDAPTWGADARVAFVHAGRCGIDVAHGDGTGVRRLTRTC